ncbi:unnamed protein product [Anisakis simplex]|uniref:Uncharacterized protein n=1 Tax=Anisakis simplex TaxID=6269 RepID=A0A0M3K0V0_ANISI|nr:unnamed protein product [Anisakis simplex]
MPCESPSEYYAAPPSNEPPLFDADRHLHQHRLTAAAASKHQLNLQLQQQQNTISYLYTPDGKRVGSGSNQQSQSVESLWAGTIKRSIVYQMGSDQLQRKAISCCNFNDYIDILNTPNKYQPNAAGDDATVPSAINKWIRLNQQKLKLSQQEQTYSSSAPSSNNSQTSAPINISTRTRPTDYPQPFPSPNYPQITLTTPTATNTSTLNDPNSEFIKQKSMTLPR